MGHVSASALIVIVCLCWSVFSRVLDEPTINETIAVLATSQILPTLPIVVLGSANERCRSDSRRLLDNLRNSSTWAVQMLDASTKSVQGVFIGNSYQLGNFGECITTEIPIRSQFCIATLTIEPPASQPVDHAADIYNPYGSIWNKIGHVGDKARIARNVAHYALCVPASCSHSDLEASLVRHLAATSNNVTINVKVKPQLCQTDRREEPLSVGSIAYCILLAAILLLVTLSTLCDNNTYSIGGDDPGQDRKIESGKSDGYVQCFSLKRNLFELGKTSKSRLGSTYGIKVISTFGVIFAHTALFSLGGPMLNYEYFAELRDQMLIYDIMAQVETVVNTFFLISGMLVSFITLRQLEKNSVNPILLIIHRYLRLTPVYAFVLIFPATLMFHLGSGPLWTAVMDKERQYCVQNWWTNLLFINTYVKDDQMCLIHTWYLAAEFHFFILSTFLVVLIHKHPRCGYVTLALTTAASLVVPFAITYIYKMDPVQFFYDDQRKLGRAQPYFRYLYTKSHVHATPYLLGLATGIVMHRLRSHDANYTWQPTLGVAAGLLMSVCSLIPGALMIMRVWSSTTVWAALEQPQRRLFWPLGIAIVIISFAFHKNGRVNKFLSSRAMVILSKLTYSAYLVSFCLQLLDFASITSPREQTTTTVLRRGLSDSCVSFAVAVVLYLMVEAPMDNVVKKLMTRKIGKKSSKA